MMYEDEETTPTEGETPEGSTDSSSDETPTPAPTAEDKAPIDAIRAELSEQDFDAESDTPEEKPVVEAEVKADDAKSDGEGEDEGDEIDLKSIIEELLKEHDTQKETAKQREDAEAAFAEAVKKAEEEGDYEELGRLFHQSIKATQQAEAVAADEQKVLERARVGFAQELDTVVASVWGDVIDSLTAEDLKSLDRSNFKTPLEHTTAVFKHLDSKRQEMVRSSVGKETSERAAETAAAAGKVRSEQAGIRALPGGTPSESKLNGSDIGTLMRQGLAGALDTEEDQSD